MESKSETEKVATLALRAATMSLSLASAILTAKATQCVFVMGAPPYTVSYSDYNSFVYSVIANTASAILQATTIALKLNKKIEKAKPAKVVVKAVDILVLGLLSSSGGVSFAVTDGSTYAHAGPYGRRGSSICRVSAIFCGQIRMAYFLSLAAAGTASLTLLLKRVGVSLSVLSSDDESESESDCGHACRH